MQRPEFIGLLTPGGERGFSGIHRTLPFKRQQLNDELDVRIIVDDFFQQRIKLFAVRAVVIGKRDDREFWLFRAGAGLFGSLNSSWANWSLPFDCGSSAGAAKLKADTHSSNKAVIVLMLFSFSGGQGGEKVFAV